MAALSTTALMVAGGLGLVSGISEGNAARKQADFRAMVNDQKAASERKVSAEEEKDFRRVQSANFAERRAAMGASGVEAGTGTPLLTSEDFAAEVELQAQRIRSGGETRASRLEQEAELTRAAGKAAQRRGIVRGGSSLLGSYAKAFG